MPKPAAVEKRKASESRRCFMWESGKEIHEIEIHKLSNYFHVLDISCRCKLRQRNPLLVWTILCHACLFSV